MLFKPFSIKAKLAFLSGFFVLSFAVLLLYFTISNYNHHINFALQEKQGVEYLRPLTGILRILPEFRCALFHKRQEPFSRVKNELDALFLELETLNQHSKTPLPLSQQGGLSHGKNTSLFKDVTDRWETVLDDQDAYPPERCQELIGLMNKLITDIGNTSNLILDPDLDSYYLMEIILLILPQADQRLGNLSASLMEITRHSTLTDEDVSTLQIYAAMMLEIDLTHLKQAVNTVLIEDVNFYGRQPSLHANLPDALNEYILALGNLVGMLQQAAEQGAALHDATPLSGQIKKAKNAGAAFWRVASTELESLLNARIASYNQLKLEAILFSTLVIFVAIAVAFWCARSILLPLRSLTQYADQVAQGDLNARISHSFSHELDDLKKSIQTMVIQLAREMEKAQQAQERAEDASASKGNFLASMSHEIRTPLNGVLGMLQLLKITELSEEQGGYVAAALESTRGLTVILNDVLDLSKIEAGRIDLNPDEFSPAALLDSILGIFSPQYAEDNLVLERSIEPGTPKTLVGDSAKIKQVLINLVGNACKFTPPGGEIHIRAGLKKQNGDPNPMLLAFAVSDTGPGIPDEQLGKIFDTYAQAKESQARRHKGVGLGLAISRRLVELMGGKISVESQVGEGSTFYFHVSVELPSPPADAQTPS